MSKSNRKVDVFPELPSEKNSRLVDRPMFSAMLLSTLSHIILILVLSLIAFGSGSLSRPVEFLAIESNEVVFDLDTTLEVDPEPLDSIVESVEIETDLRIDLEVESPPKFEVVMADPGNSNEERADQNNSQTPADPDSVSTPLSRVAVSIQKRVSAAGGRKGEVQFALAWKNINDVDLHVVTPSGEHISHLHKHSSSHGMLDVDMNVKGESEEPVENVRWISNAPAGRYTVLINLFRIHRPKTGGRVYRGSEFQLLAQLGPDSQLISETVSRGKQVAVFRFMYIPPAVPASQRVALLADLERLQLKEEVAASAFLENAVDIKNQRQRDRVLNQLIVQYPHTDAAVDAMRMIGGSISKAGF